MIFSVEQNDFGLARRERSAEYPRAFNSAKTSSDDDNSCFFQNRADLCPAHGNSSILQFENRGPANWQLCYSVREGY